MAQQIAELAPGESKTVSFGVTPTVAKTYQVSVDGLTGSFEAIAPPIVEIMHFIWVPDTYLPGMLPSWPIPDNRTVGFGFDFKNTGTKPIDAYVNFTLKHKWKETDDRAQPFWMWRGFYPNITTQPLTVNPYTGYADKGMPIFYWNPYPRDERESPYLDRVYFRAEVIVDGGIVATTDSEEVEIEF